MTPLRPLESWLSRSPMHRAEVTCWRGRARVELHDGTDLVGVGNGASIEEASADSLNDIMRRQEREAAALEECDRVFAAERRSA